MSFIIIKDLCTGNVKNAHDIFVNLFTNVGLLGLMIFVSLMYKELRFIFKNRNEIIDNDLLFIAFIICVGNFTCALLEQGVIFPIFSDALVMWICLNYLNCKLLDSKNSIN